MARLLTHHDPMHVHAFIGLCTVLHLLYRLQVLFTKRSVFPTSEPLWFSLGYVGFKRADHRRFPTTRCGQLHRLARDAPPLLVPLAFAEESKLPLAHDLAGVSRAQRRVRSSPSALRPGRAAHRTISAAGRALCPSTAISELV
jgi:hypothetical protein